MSVMSDPLYLRVDAVRTRLEVDVCSLYLAHRNRKLLEIAATSGLNQSAVGARLPYGQGLTGKVASTGAPVAARDIQSHRDHFHVEGSGEEKYTSYLGIPLLEEGRLLGVLVIQTEQARTFFYRDIKELYNAARDLIESLADTGAQVS